MSNVKIPGFLWVVLIAVAIVLIENYVAPGYQLYAEAAIVILMGLAKAANLGTKEIEDLIELLRQMQTRVPMPESAIERTEMRQSVEAHEPNKAVRWLLG